MKALTVIPRTPDSIQLQDLPEPEVLPDEILVELLAVGICGTDREIISGKYGWAPENEDFLVIGHESLGRVIRAPKGSGFQPGDHVVSIVRWPDPVPCPHCAVEEWDMCTNGQYTEHGIKSRHGFARERYSLHPTRAIKVDPSLGDCGVLLEPASVVAKAWDHIERIGSRALFKPQKVLVTGAGPVGLLAALMAKEKGLEVYVLDRELTGLKPELVRKLGAHYLTDVKEVGERVPSIDVIIECTGAANLILEVTRWIGPDGIVCLAGLSSGSRKLEFDVASWNQEIVLENVVVFGSVNANRRHYQMAAEALKNAPRDWLNALITDRTPLTQWQKAFEKKPGTIKSILIGSGA